MASYTSALQRLTGALDTLPKRDREDARRVLVALIHMTRATYTAELARWGREDARNLISRPLWGECEIARSGLGERRKIRTRNLLARLRDAGVVISKTTEGRESRTKRYAWGRHVVYESRPWHMVRWGLDPEIALEGTVTQTKGTP